MPRHARMEIFVCSANEEILFHFVDWEFCMKWGLWEEMKEVMTRYKDKSIFNTSRTQKHKNKRRESDRLKRADFQGWSNHLFHMKFFFPSRLDCHTSTHDALENDKFDSHSALWNHTLDGSRKTLKLCRFFHPVRFPITYRATSIRERYLRLFNMLCQLEHRDTFWLKRVFRLSLTWTCELCWNLQSHSSHQR